VENQWFQFSKTIEIWKKLSETATISADSAIGQAVGKPMAAIEVQQT
jgi:hypothetical protein